jgi:hypothetical protein
MDGGFVWSLGRAQKNQPSTLEMLKVVEVLVLLVAGVCFVAWQFRDLRRARDITRQQREAERAQAMNASSKAQPPTIKRGLDGG